MSCFGGAPGRPVNGSMDSVVSTGTDLGGWKVSVVEEEIAMFPSIFNDMYEEKIIDKIYMTNETIISKSDFIEAIGGSFDQAPRADFIFSPKRVRKLIWERGREGAAKSESWVDLAE